MEMKVDARVDSQEEAEKEKRREEKKPVYLVDGEERRCFTVCV